MQENICEICGGRIVYKNGRYVCESCGSFLPEKISEEEHVLLIEASSKLRNMQFDEAQIIYEDIVSNYPKCFEAYWGIALSQYGIKYENDYDGKKKPSCYNASYESLYTNSNYKKAVSLADKKQKEYYEKQAKLIEEVRKEWVEKAQQEKPYDIFLSYKDSELFNDTGGKSEDGKICQKIYNHLVDKGYTVFFSRVSLKDKTGEHYEPYIFNALNTAKVMLVFGSKVEYFTSTWMKNEWSRFYKRIKEGHKAKNAISVIFKNINPAELPSPLNSLQNIEYNRDTFLEELDNYVSKVINQAANVLPVIERRSLKTLNEKQKKISELKTEEFEVIGKNTAKGKKVLTRVTKLETYKAAKLKPGIESTLATAETYLAKRDFDNALKFFDKALDIDKNNINALVGRIISQNDCTTFDDYIENNFGKSVDFKGIVQLFKMVDEDTRKIIADKILSVFEDSLDRGKISNDLKDAYLELDHYDIPSIRYVNTEILNAFSARANTVDRFDNNCFLVLKDIFEIVASYEDDDESFKNSIISFINCLPMFIEKNGQSSVNNIIESCIDGYIDKYGYDENSIDLKYCFNYKTESASLAYNNIESNDDIEFIDELITSSKQDGRDYIFKILKQTLSEFLAESDYSKAYLLCNYLLRKKFEQKEDFINLLKEYFAVNSKPESVELFELYLKSFKQSQFATFIKTMYEFAKNATTELNFDLAEEYYDKIISFNPAYGKAYKGKICCKYKIPEIDRINVESFDDYELLELWLGNITENNKAKTLNIWLDLCIDSLNKKNKDRIIEVFNRLLSYYPIEETSLQVTKLNMMGTALKELEFFDDASKIYWTILGVNKNDHAAHWGLLQTELKCKDNDDLARCLIPIGDNDHFQDAITSSGTNKDILEEYIECQHRQSDYIKSYRLRKKVFKISLSILIPLSALCVISVSVLHYINKLRPSIYTNKCISQIEKGNYDAAIKTISNTNYKEKENLVALSNAMKAFDEKDFVSGINKLPSVTKLNINYLDVNGKYLAIDTKLQNNSSFYKLIVSTDKGSFYWKQDYFVLDISELDSKNNDYSYNIYLYLKASIPLYDYSISYDLDGGNNSNKQNEYNILSNFSIYSPTKTGYTFTGWSFNGSNLNSAYDSLNKLLTIGYGSYGDINLKANYTANTYMITYDYGYNNKKEYQYVVYDDEFAIKGTPTRTGYKFLGWKKTDGTYLKPGTWKSASSITITADWEGNDNYVTVDYDKDDFATNGFYTVKSGQNLGFLFDSSFLSKVTKKGYNFTGWYALINGVETQITKYFELTTSLTIYAKWEAKTNTVNIYSSSYLSSTQLITTLKIKSGNDLEKLFSDSFSIPSISRFEGWYTKIDGVEVRLNKEHIVLSDLDIYAKTSTSGYYLYFIKKNLSDNFYYDFLSVSNSKGSEILNTENEIVSTDGRKFCGWMLDNRTTITPYLSIANYSVICPIWVDSSYNVARIKVSSTTNYVLEYVAVYSGSGISKIFESTYINDLPTGYGKFAGWYLGSSQLTFNNSIVNSMNDIYAKWTSSTSYSNCLVKFKANNSDTAYYSFLVIPKGSKLNDYITTLGANPPIPTKAGYTITQWILSETSSGTVDVNYTVNNNLTVAPVWQLVNYSINYVLNGGTNDASNISTYNVNTGEIVIKNPTRKGYTFAGWDFELGTKITDLRINSTTCKNLTLTAQWNPNKNVITFNANGGGGTMDNQIVTTGEAFNIKKCSFTAPAGKKFGGWAIGNSGIISYSDQQNIAVDESITLTAIWVNLP